MTAKNTIKETRRNDERSGRGIAEIRVLLAASLVSLLIVLGSNIIAVSLRGDPSKRPSVVQWVISAYVLILIGEREADARGGARKGPCKPIDCRDAL